MITRKDIIHPNKLRILAKVIELNSVTQAAKALAITQPAVSHALHQLEETFNTPLMHKHGNSITFTPAANKLATYWNEFSNLYEQMHHAIRDNQNITAINVAMISTAHHFIPQQLSALHATHTHYQFSYHILSAELAIEAIKRGEYAIGIAINPPTDDRIHTQYLKKEVLQWVASSHSPWANHARVTFKDLESQPMIIRQRTRLMTQSLFSYFDKHQSTPNILYEIDDTEAVKRAVMNNQGLAVLPREAVKTEIQEGKLIAFRPTDFTEDQHLHWQIMQSRHTENDPNIAYAINHLIQVNAS